MYTREDIERLKRELSNPNAYVRGNAAGFLGNAAFSGEDISVAVPALVKLLSDENDWIRGNAAGALRCAADNGTDISAGVPALMEALSDGDHTVTKTAAWTLERIAEKTSIDLEKVKKTLTRFVEKKGEGEAEEWKGVEREAAGYYLDIANAESKRRKSIDMDGLLLDGKIKPPKGPKMYRQRVAV